MINFELKTYPDNYNVKKRPLDPARAYIAVIGQPRKEVDGEEFISVSHKCRSFKEFDEDVNRLIEELKKMKKRAKIFFDSEKQTRPKMLDKP